MNPTAVMLADVPSVAGRSIPGGIQLRCLTPDDADQMAELLARMSPHSRYLRYFRVVSSFAARDLARFVDVGHRHRAVGAFDEGVLVGAAHYFRATTHPHRAEIALEIADSHHRRGIGTALVEEIARLAVSAGITQVTATVLRENRAVLRLVQRLGGDTVVTPDGSYADIVSTLPAPRE